MGYPPQGTKVNVDDLLGNVAIIEAEGHSRSRVYPQNVGNTITPKANAAANTFGDWTEIVPINTIGFNYDVIGIVVESVDAKTSYFIQLGYSTATGDDPTTAQIQGERRFEIADVPPTRGTEILQSYSQNTPANAKLWGRLKTASTNTDEAEVSVVITRHQEISNPISLLTTWPWTT